MERFTKETRRSHFSTRKSFLVNTSRKNRLDLLIGLATGPGEEPRRMIRLGTGSDRAKAVDPLV